jgi:hypothetical protein
MQKKIFMLLAALSVAVAAAQAQGDAPAKARLIVFVVGLNNPTVADYISSLVGNELARRGRYDVIPRTEAVKKKLAELRDYEDAGHVDDRELIEWGRQHNVSALCLVHVVYMDEYLFSAQLTDVKSGRLVGSGEYAIPTAKGDDVKKAASAIAAQLQREIRN